MRPPPQPKYRSQFNQPKIGSCANERMGSYPINCSSGSLSMNETKSSYDESINLDRTASTEFSEFDNKKRNDVDEQEPEWFSAPASRHDVIDLHGFDDDEGYRGHSTDDMMTTSDRSNGKNQRQNHHNQKQQKTFNYNNGGKVNYQQQKQQQIYRHPLQQSSK
jgi:hypothetical protein